MIIYKYPINNYGYSEVDLGDSDVVLDAGFQAKFNPFYVGSVPDNQLFIWVLKQHKGIVKPRAFTVYYTGEELHPRAGQKYIKTIHHNGLVYHLFEG